MTAVWIGCIILGLIAAGTLGMSVYVGRKLTRPPRKPVDMLPERFGIETYENIRFLSRDGSVTLSGWYFSTKANGRKPTGMTLILSHGYSQNRQEPHLPALALASALVDSGFDVLMYDFRNAGQSEGDITTVGYLEKQDLLGAIDYAAARNPENRIGLIGFSMGAAASLLAAAEDGRVEAVVADSPFYSLKEYLKENMQRWTGLPHVPFTWLILRVMPLMVRADLQQVNPWQAVERIVPRPILLVHGTGDETIPHNNSLQLQQKAGEHAELWLVPGAGHVRSFAMSPETYVNRVIHFFRRCCKTGVDEIHSADADSREKAKTP